MHDDVLQFITKRRSIRKFTGEAIDRELLLKALEAAMAAPSANNSRPWSFVVVTEAEKVRAVSAAHPYASFGEQAGAIILPFGKKDGYGWFDQDMGAATENLLLALTHLGLGATWCGMAEEHQASVRAIVPIPEEMHFFALIPVGIPAEEKEARTQFEESRVYWERYTASH